MDEASAAQRKLYASLHPMERGVLPHLAGASGQKQLPLSDVVAKSGMEEVSVSRALLWLANKGLVVTSEEEREEVALTLLGQEYSRKGLPEHRLLVVLDEPTCLSDAAKKAGLDVQEASASMGVLRGKAALTITASDKGPMLSLTVAGEAMRGKQGLEDKFLSGTFPRDRPKLAPEEQHALSQLLSRKKILEVRKSKEVSVALTSAGKELLSHWDALDKAGLAEKLTAEMLRDGSWKDVPFRRFDVTAPVPKRTVGRRQHYRAFLDSVREQFMALGFSEMQGPIVESEFWDMDVLYMPQFHSARDIHDAYFVKEPASDPSLPAALVAKVKAAHEHGGATGSKGWRYDFDDQRTRRNILRTQGTALSARMLASPGLQVPGKYFAIARCFRYDVIDATHLPDFNQVEGIVAEEGLTMRHLFGLLELLAREIAGAKETRIVPAYFPFTEPSAALYAKHPDMGWIELGGSGMFRPEMRDALGVSVPVIAWGIGVDRLAMFKLGINDIRELFSADVATLRNARFA
ncbi:hypothetical protein AUJ68_04445 [Candidatus Woesearchaeota archaeon CG1_02_57_44]|nr:MAG: hypothetical protein AUJ68_04445 [Candidatus Woesearchaeota archaeon CG1_02_57_44]